MLVTLALLQRLRIEGPACLAVVIRHSQIQPCGFFQVLAVALLRGRPRHSRILLLRRQLPLGRIFLSLQLVFLPLVYLLNDLPD